MRSVSLAIALVSSSFAAPALAQDQAATAITRAPAADLAVGAAVYDKNGAELGTIAEVADGNVVIAVGEHRAAFAATAFGKTAQGLHIAMAKAELTAALEGAAAETAAKLAAALQVGVDVRSRGGRAVVGQVKSVSDESVEVTTTGGAVLVPRSAMIMTGAGLAVNLSAEQFADAVKQATAGAPAG